MVFGLHMLLNSPVDSFYTLVITGWLVYMRKFLSLCLLTPSKRGAI